MRILWTILVLGSLLQGGYANENQAAEANKAAASTNPTDKTTAGSTPSTEKNNAMVALNSVTDVSKNLETSSSLPSPASSTSSSLPSPTSSSPPSLTSSSPPSPTSSSPPSPTSSSPPSPTSSSPPSPTSSSPPSPTSSSPPSPTSSSPPSPTSSSPPSPMSSASSSLPSTVSPALKITQLPGAPGTEQKNTISTTALTTINNTDPGNITNTTAKINTDSNDTVTPEPSTTPTTSTTPLAKQVTTESSLRSITSRAYKMSAPVTQTTPVETSPVATTPVLTTVSTTMTTTTTTMPTIALKPKLFNRTVAANSTGDKLEKSCARFMEIINATLICNMFGKEINGDFKFSSVNLTVLAPSVEGNKSTDSESQKQNEDFPMTSIAIMASCGALALFLIAFAVYCSCHRLSYRKNQQHLTEELHTVENGYHDNPTLEVMEVQPEMQEKTLALNGELNDSWIVPFDNLEEEDTHL